MIKIVVQLGCLHPLMRLSGCRTVGRRISHLHIWSTLTDPVIFTLPTTTSFSHDVHSSSGNIWCQSLFGNKLHHKLAIILKEISVQFLKCMSCSVWVRRVELNISVPFWLSSNLVSFYLQRINNTELRKQLPYDMVSCLPSHVANVQSVFSIFKATLRSFFMKLFILFQLHIIYYYWNRRWKFLIRGWNCISWLWLVWALGRQHFMLDRFIRSRLAYYHACHIIIQAHFWWKFNRPYSEH